MYFYGARLMERGGPDDLRGAHEWLTAAAEAGYERAMLALGRLLSNGQIPRDVRRARRWLTTAAASNNGRRRRSEPAGRARGAPADGPEDSAAWQLDH